MRLFLVLGLGLFVLGCGSEGPETLTSGEVQTTFRRGAVNSLALEAGGQRVFVYGSPEGAEAEAEAVLFTHHRRDVVWSGRAVAEAGAKVYAPAAERPLFEEVDRFWDEFRTARFHDYAQQSTKVLIEPLEIDEEVRDGERIELLGGAVTAQVMETPGYTRGAVSYLFEVDGQRIAAVGDLIWGDGQIHDLYSLQDAIPEANVRGYHGYAARAAAVIESLRRVLAWEPDVLAPARGPLIRDPEQAIGKLIARLQQLFRSYYRTDALRWYWGDDNLRLRASRVLSDAAVEWMPLARDLQEIPPHWLRKFGTSRLIISDSGEAFLIDSGSDEIMRQILDLRDRGGFDRIVGVFVTHYHDDHTDRVQAMAEECRCPVYAGPEVADILERPEAYHMPAETDRPVAEVRRLGEGEQIRWQEYTLTYTYFPGQAIYHGGLTLERDSGEKYFFIGDSFSPSGLDDYCILNRHFLHPNLGHFLCLRKIRELDPSYWLVNQHIEPAFRYSPEQLDEMEATLEAKRQTVAELVPWPDPNFGLDEQWIRLYPYGSSVAAGEELTLYAVVFNHAPDEQEFQVRLRLPPGWEGSPEATVRVPPRQQAQAEMRIRPPAGSSGFHVLSADVSLGDRELPQWLEALVDIP